MMNPIEIHCAAFVAAMSPVMLEMRKANKPIARSNLCKLSIEKVDLV